jgi:hypothetical protein
MVLDYLIDCYRSQLLQGKSSFSCTSVMIRQNFLSLAWLINSMEVPVIVLLSNDYQPDE